MSFESMEFAVGKKQRLCLILVVMGECAVALGSHESENKEAESTGELLLEGTLLLVRKLRDT